MTLFEILCNNEQNIYTGGLTDEDLAHLAQWASNNAKEIKAAGFKRAFSLIREGADLLLRHRILWTKGVSAWTANNASMANITQDPKESTKPLSEY